MKDEYILSDDDRVIALHDDFAYYAPYCLDYKTGLWNECSGKYKLSYAQTLSRMGKLCYTPVALTLDEFMAVCGK